MIVFTLFLGLESAEGKLLACAAAGIVLLAVLYFIFLPKQLSGAFGFPAEGNKNQKIQGYFRMEYPGRLPIFYGKAYGKICNLLTKEETPFQVTISLMRRGEGIAPLEVLAPHMGIIEVSVSRAELAGLLGLRKKVWFPKIKKEIVVLPETREVAGEFQLKYAAVGEGEEEMPSWRGFDSSLYQGVRPYADGDSLKHMHWKLTGRTGEYMVKELGEPANVMPVLFLETSLRQCTARKIDILMERYISFSQDFTEKGIKHFLCWKDRKSGEFFFHRVNGLPDLDVSFMYLLRINFVENGGCSLEEALEKWEEFGWWLCFDDSKEIRVVDKSEG